MSAKAPPWASFSHEVTGTFDLKKIGLGWKVIKNPIYCDFDGLRIKVPTVRALMKDKTVLSVVSERYSLVQNEEAFRIFEEFSRLHNMKIWYAGAVKDGRFVWALARPQDGMKFQVAGDSVEGCLLLTHKHEYGRSMEARYCAIHHAKMTTFISPLDVSFRGLLKKEESVYQVHANYQNAAELLANSAISKEQAEIYFAAVFGNPSRAAQKAMNIFLEVSRPVWWDAFSAVNFIIDHQLGNALDTRLISAWYGANSKRKLRAYSLAIKRGLNEGSTGL